MNLDDLVADAGKRDTTFKEIGALFDEMAAILRLPTEQQEARWAARAATVKDSHPLTQRAWKVGVMARRVFDGQAIMRDMLSKAVRVIESPRAADDVMAARLVAPHEFVRRRGGFALRRVRSGEKTPYVLTIGPHDAHDWDAMEKRQREIEEKWMLDDAPSARESTSTAPSRRSAK